MISIIKHRGPDEFGIYRDRDIGLGHARLSIIDLSSGQQPMSNEDETIWLSFNGEIFNFVELRETLIQKGHEFKTHSDTEVIIHLYEDYGHQCLDYLNGQFAFSLWDTNKKELFLARDRMGIRPLFYSVFRDRFYFASEIKSILATNETVRAIDPSALDEIFTLWHTAGLRTAFKGINELPPSHFILVKKGEVLIKRYWDIDFSRTDNDISIEDASERLKELLIDSTRLRLRADVPVGAYLSGGLDSSVITALIRNYTDSPLETFSVAFEDEDYDESSFQMEMAKALGTNHHEVRCSYDDISSVFPDVIWHTEKPVLRTASAPLFLLSRLVRRNNFKVVMTGEGADEVLGGYDIFREAKIRAFWSRVPDSQCRPMLLKRLYPYLPAFQGQSNAYRSAFFNGGLNDMSDWAFSHRPRWQTTEKNKAFFSDDLKAMIKDSEPEKSFMESLSNRVAGWDPVARAQYLETCGLLPGYILSSQGDRVSMGNSIEGRFPFLDHRVVSFCSTLPLHYKIRGLNEKYILKRSMKAYLPEGIVKRKKQPYLAPDNKSFFCNGKSPDYVTDLLSEKRIKEYGYFNPERVGLLLNKCSRGAVMGFKDNMALVGILSTQLHHNKFIEEFPQNVKPAGNIRIIDRSGDEKN